MRISELSRQTGVPVATIKFYLRDRLLPAGERTARNQAEYGECHRRRLLAIRACTEVIGLDLSSTRAVLAAIDDHAMPLTDLFDVVNNALLPQQVPPYEVGGLGEAARQVDEFLDEAGWSADAGSPTRARLIQLLTAMRRLGCEPGMRFFVPYAELAERLAACELDMLPGEIRGTDRGAAVMRSMLFDVVLVTMRRLAHEHLLTQRLKSRSH